VWATSLNYRFDDSSDDTFGAVEHVPTPGVGFEID
jgi:hypothetical protein